MVSAVFTLLFFIYHLIEGHSVVQIRLIIKPVMLQKDGVANVGLDQFLAYVERFDIVPQSGSASTPNPSTGMYVLRRALRSDGSRQGHIVPIKFFRAPIMLVPRHGLRADGRYSKENSMECASEFWLNHYFNKELFYSLQL